ncbi:MAG: ComEC/Rec2 family competence protein, partial [Propionibacteriaceae bacterium]|nr:ComEC/Rec2 family competence protein [Propionibacteriaceae bacterium]
MSASRDLDLRTPLVALAVWAGAWCGVAAGWAWLVAAALAVGVGLCAWRWRNRALAVAAVCVIASGGLGALSWWADESSPLTTLARDRAVVHVTAVVTGDVVYWEPRGTMPGRTVVAVNVRQAQARGQAWALRQPASLVLTDGKPELVVGQTIAVTARATWLDDSLTPELRLTAAETVTVVRQPDAFNKMLNRARAGLRDSMVHSPPDQAGLVPGLVVGDTSQLSPSLKEAFRVTSLSHLTAVSGSNLTLMIVFLVATARVVGVRGWWLRGLTAVATVLFVALCRADASVLRAAAMGVVGLAATGVSVGQGRGLRHWGVAISVVCLLQPAMTHSWGFALSAAATAGILWWAPLWRQAMGRWAPLWLAEAIAIPLAAQVATQPLVTALNGQVSLVGIFANMVAAPFVGPVTVLGLMACVLAAPLQPVATALGWLAGWFSEPIILAANGGGALPGATLAWGAAQWGAVALALAALTACCWLVSLAVPHVLRRWWTTGLAMAVMGISIVIPAQTPGWPGQWTVAFCDIGQGDAAVLHVGDGVGVLVDAGPDPPALHRCLSELGVRRLALVVISHEHADHMAGAAGLVRYVHVDLVLVRDGLPADAAAQTAALLGNPVLPVQTALTGQTVSVGPLQWTTLHSGPLMQATTRVGEGEDP